MREGCRPRVGVVALREGCRPRFGVVALREGCRPRFGVVALRPGLLPPFGREAFPRFGLEALRLFRLGDLDFWELFALRAFWELLGLEDFFEPFELCLSPPSMGASGAAAAPGACGGVPVAAAALAPEQRTAPRTIMLQVHPVR